MGRVQKLKGLAFSLYPLSFFLYSPFKLLLNPIFFCCLQMRHVFLILNQGLKKKIALNFYMNFIFSAWWIMWPGFLWLVYGETVYRSNRKVSKYLSKFFYQRDCCRNLKWLFFYRVACLIHNGSLKKFEYQEWLINRRISNWKFIFISTYILQLQWRKWSEFIFTSFLCLISFLVTSFKIK